MIDVSVPIATAASLKCVARLSSIATQPSIISAKNSFSQSAPLPYALETTRITQLPPDADSIRNSVASGVTDSGRGQRGQIGHGSVYAKRLVGV